MLTYLVANIKLFLNKKQFENISDLILHQITSKNDSKRMAV